MKQGNKTLAKPLPIQLIIEGQKRSDCNASAKIIDLDKYAGVQGETLNVAITGLNTNFEQGKSELIFGTGITVGRLDIAGPTQAAATITIAENSPIGNSKIIVVTGEEVACFSPNLATPSGFRVNPKEVAIPPIPETEIAFAAAVSNTQSDLHGAKANWNKNTGTPGTIYGFLSRSLTGSPEEKARQFLITNNNVLLLPEDLNNLQLINTSTLGGAEHIYFTQMYQGMPVYNTEVSVHIQEALSKAQLVHATYYPNIVLSNKAKIIAEQAIAIAKNDLNYKITSVNGVKSNLVVYPHYSEFLLAWQVIIPSWEYLIQADNGEIISKIDQAKNAGGTVYLENPQATPYLSNQSFYNLDSSGYLKGYYTDVDNAASQRAFNNTSFEFFYQPTDTHFDEAMVYYHIDNIYYYFSIRGFDINNVVPAIVHYGCYDNAYFDPTTKKLYFCEPSQLKDTAKYADVIYHEYTHAVINKIKPGLIYANESGAINEGTADFFSGSALRNSCLAEWIGNSPCLRDLNNGKSIFDKIDNVHADGEIWGGACWTLFNSSGFSEEVDRMILGAIAYLPNNAMFIDGLLGIFHADRDLYQGKYCHQIYNAFNLRFIRLDNYSYRLPPVIVSPTNDFFQIYTNDNTTIRADACDPNGDFISYRWETSGGTLSENSVPNVNWTAPSLPGNYTISLTVDDGQGGRTLKTITAQVTDRPPPPPPPVSIDYFRYGPNPFSDYINFFFKINVTATVTIKIFNVAGDLVMERSDVADGGQDINWTLDTKNLARGIYFAVIYAGSDSKRVEKMAKN